MIKCHPPVVFARISNLVPYFAALYSWHETVSVQISALHYKHSQPIVIQFTWIFWIRNDDPCQYKSIVACPTHVAWPPLCCIKRGCMDYELLLGMIVSGSRLYALNVRSMTYLCLSVRPNDVKVV